MNEDSALLHKNTLVGFGFLGGFIFLAKWFNPERAIGFGLLFSAAIVAIEPFRKNSMFEVLIKSTGLEVFVLSSWFLFAAIYLLKKGNQASFGALLLCVAPMTIVTIGSLWFSIKSNGTPSITGTDISREIVIHSLLMQRLTTRFVSEIIEQTEALKGRDK